MVRQITYLAIRIPTVFLNLNILNFIFLKPEPKGMNSPENQDRTGQDRTGQDRTGQDRTGQDRTGQDRTGQDRSGQDRSGQDRSGQDRSGQDRSGQDRSRQDRSGQDRSGQDLHAYMQDNKFIISHFVRTEKRFTKQFDHQEYFRTKIQEKTSEFSSFNTCDLTKKYACNISYI